MKNINFELALKKYIRIESNLNLFSMIVDGIPIWEIVRYPLFKKILIELGLENETMISRFNKWDKCIWLLKALKYLFLSLFLNNPFFIKKKSVIFISHSRSKYEDNGYTDIYTNPIIDSIKDRYSCAALEHPDVKYLHKNKSNCKVYYLDCFYFIFKICKAIKNIYSKPKYLNSISLLERDINEAFKLNLNINIFLDKYKLGWESEVFFYNKWLRWVKPKIIIVADGAKNKSIIYAAKILEIAVVELQHGSPARGKLNYDFPENILNLPTFPDIFLTFGDYWTKSSDYPIHKDKVISLGFPYISKKIERFRTVSKKDALLVLSQPTVSESLASYVIFVKEKNPNLEVVYKLHPKENISDRVEYSTLKKLGVTLVKDEVDLYELFSACKWQLGVYSTALYEGLMFSCQTFVLNIVGCEFMKDLIDKKIVHFLSVDEDITSFLSSDVVSVPEYFSSYSVNKICFVIDKYSKD